MPDQRHGHCAHATQVRSECVVSRGDISCVANLDINRSSTHPRTLIVFVGLLLVFVRCHGFLRFCIYHFFQFVLDQARTWQRFVSKQNVTIAHRGVRFVVISDVNVQIICIPIYLVDAVFDGKERPVTVSA